MIRIPGPIPITIHPMFWLLAGALGWMNGNNLATTLIWMGIILVSVTVHELGHALTAVAFGQKASIDLVAFGGLTQRKGGKLRPWQHFVVVMNGPLAGFLLCLLAYYAKNWFSGSHYILLYVLSITAAINLFWTVLNLLPIQPLDGGKLVEIILEKLFGMRGLKISYFVSIVLAAIMALVFFSYQSFLAGCIFMLLGYESYRMWQSSLQVSENDRSLVVQHLLKDAEKDILGGKQEEALRKIDRVLELTGSGLVYTRAIENKAYLLANTGKAQEAYDLLNNHRKKLTPKGTHLLLMLAFKEGLWKDALQLGTEVYKENPSYDVAAINACCSSLLGQVRPAIGWIQCAIREGIPNVREFLQRKEFDSIRLDPLFQEIAK